MSNRKSSLSAGELTLYDCQKKNRTAEESSCSNADTVQGRAEGGFQGFQENPLNFNQPIVN